jgi:hypothetical protein
VLFAFRLAGPAAGRRFALPGLAADGRYRVTAFGAPPVGASGAALAQGLEIGIAETYRSALCLVEAL